MPNLCAYQLPRESWHEWIGDETLADAILDRLVHNAYNFDLKGLRGEQPRTETTTCDASSHPEQIALRGYPHRADTSFHFAHSAEIAGPSFTSFVHAPRACSRYARCLRTGGKRTGGPVLR